MKTTIYNFSLLNPHFVSGFTEANGSFIISIEESPSMRFGYTVRPRFVLTQHKNSRPLLDEIKQFFNNAGYLTLDHRSGCYNLNIDSVPALLQVVIPHFSDPRYTLLGTKNRDFLIWRHIVNLVSKEVHFNIEGLIYIIELSLKMYSRNVSKKKHHIIRNLNAKYKFDKYKEDPLKPIEHLILEHSQNTWELDPWFLTGVMQGDGKPLGIKNNGQIAQTTTIGLEVNSISIMNKIQAYFNGIGQIKKIKENYYRFTVYDKNDILSEIVPHLEKYPLRGYRQWQYLESLELLKDPRKKWTLAEKENK